MLNRPRKIHLLQVLAYLQHRTLLTEEDEGKFYSLNQGYKGELAFTHLLQRSLRKEYIVLYGPSIGSSNGDFQMDCLIISEAQIYLLEIKHFRGDYYFQDNNLYQLKTKKRIKNPFYQLQRCEDLLRESLQKHNLHYAVHSYVIFNHPTFTLYQAPVQMNMILPTQVERFVEKLNKQAIRSTSYEKTLVEMLYREHQERSRFEKLPEYHYKDLRKGILCLKCKRRMIYVSRGFVQCDVCSGRESVDSAVLRNVVEYSVLLSDEKIKTIEIQKWCDELLTPKTVRSVLNKYLVKQGEGRATYYEFIKNDKSGKINPYLD